MELTYKNPDIKHIFMIKKGKINIFYPIIFDLIINIFALNLSIPECF